jgi:hypothetical protein
MSNGNKWKQYARNEPGEINAFTPEETKVLREMTGAMKKGFPWIDAKPEARLVAYCATFPRSIAGNRQDDQLLRKIYHTWQHYRHDVQLARLQIVEMVSSQVALKEDSNIEGLGGDEHPGSLSSPASELAKLVSELARLSRGQSFQPKTDAEFFSRIAEDLNYLDTYKPTAGDHAVEALQDAFVGLMKSKYAWGKKGLPTKGEVTAMAKARLEQLGKKFDFSKAYWSELLQMAGFGDWLPAGRAGRPSRASLDENVKAEREYKSLCTQAIKDFHGGDIIRARDFLKAAFRSKSEYQRSEQERFPGPAQPKKRNQSE